ncbi:hypothetical protein CHCC14809_2110 [Bacillus licheniformis]|nr:hypothetical protein CHCC15087_4649 [Bacillus licheniformis]TWM71951.1 hypothetical protein CHCC14809_2110 [Bacillus licheniformis]
MTAISQGERVGKLDIIRGFALLGILLAHREVVFGCGYFNLGLLNGYGAVWLAASGSFFLNSRLKRCGYAIW